MLTPFYTKKFNKDTKLAIKRKNDMQKMRIVMKMLENEIPLPPANNEHPLHGNYNKCLECHITPDWVLIYRIDKSKKKVIFLRTGSHSDLL